MINIVCINTTNFKVAFLSIKNLNLKQDFCFCYEYFSCKVVAAKFQSLLDNFYNNLTIKNSLHYVVVVHYLETEEILCIVVLNFKCSANIIICHIM